MDLAAGKRRDRRRSTRSELQLPVVVKWDAPDGSPREEITKTLVVNTHGCLVYLKAPLPEGMDVELRNGVSDEVRKGRVAWSGEVTLDGRNKVGIELEEADAAFLGPQYAEFARWVTFQDS